MTEASPEHKLRVCAYVRVSTNSEKQLKSFDIQIGKQTKPFKKVAKVAMNLVVLLQIQNQKFLQ